MGLYLPHGATWMHEGVVTHVQGGDQFPCEFSNPITELVATVSDEAALLKIQGMIDRKFGVVAITGSSEFWGIYSVV